MRKDPPLKAGRKAKPHDGNSPSKGGDKVLRAPKRRFSATKTPQKSSIRKGQNSTQRPPSTQNGVGGLLTGFMIELGMLAITGLVALCVVVVYYAIDLPDTNSLWRPDRQVRYTILARDGSPLSVNGTQFGAPVRLVDLPPHVTQAVLAVEDRNFHHHFGVNPFSVLRALMVNAGHGSVRQGGSTITQQLAKNLFLSSEKTLKRKIQELLLSLWLERRFSKDEILTLYLNRVYLGAGAYGIDAASFRYFGKPASRLSLNEAALIAGLLKAPSRYNPTHNPLDAGLRAQTVVESMVAAGFIDQQTANTAINTPIYLKPPTFSAAGYFIDEVIRQTRVLAPNADADLIIRTTFDPALQYVTEKGLEEQITAGTLHDKGGDGLETAIVVADKYGAVRAMIGGQNYQRSQFNRATMSKRQPGSAFKPFIYLAAMEAGAHPEHRIIDQPVTIGKWSPGNYKNKYYGDVSLTTGLSKSLNSVAVRLQEWAGRDRVRKTAMAMGLPGPLNPDAALALGTDGVSPLKLAQAYLPFANGGYRMDTHLITSIQTAEGIPLYQHQNSVNEIAASPNALAHVNMMMRRVVTAGTGRNAAIPGWDVAGKTGTTQGSRDAWFAGHAGGLVTIVWVGKDDYQPMNGVTGGRAPAKIWSSVMKNILTAMVKSQELADDNFANTPIQTQTPVQSNNSEIISESAGPAPRTIPPVSSIQRSQSPVLVAQPSG